MEGDAMKISVFALVASFALAFTGIASAQSIGQQEFMDSCAQCHGGSGMGDGPLAGYLNTAIPDLTKIQADNGGVFPVTDIYRIIEGSAIIGAHGTRDMPAWGSRFEARGALVANPDFQEEEAETYARFRMLALVEYLASIQQE
jgi:mono/diheme cytochrome c family protein